MIHVGFKTLNVVQGNYPAGSGINHMNIFVKYGFRPERKEHCTKKIYYALYGVWQGAPVKGDVLKLPHYSTQALDSSSYSL